MVDPGNPRRFLRSAEWTVSSAFAVYTAIATAFSSSRISFLKPCPLAAIATTCCTFSHVGASFSMWVRVFNFYFPDKMKSCRHKRCGCEFSHPMWVRVFNLHFPDTMKSCRHTRYRHLILDWFRTGGGDLVGRRQGIQRQGETDRQKSLWLENAARHRNRDISPDGIHPTRAEMYPQILLRRLFRGQFQPPEKGHHNCKSRGYARPLGPRADLTGSGCRGGRSCYASLRTRCCGSSSIRSQPT